MYFRFPSSFHTSSTNSTNSQGHPTDWVEISTRGYIKINFDGTHSSSGAAAGFIIRDWVGRFIQAGTRFLEGAPILVAEATAMRDGIQSTLVAGYRNLLVEGDNKVVIQAIQGHIHISWQIHTLLRDIHNMIPPYVHCLFQHIYRDCLLYTSDAADE